MRDRSPVRPGRPPWRRVPIYNGGGGTWCRDVPFNLYLLSNSFYLASEFCHYFKLSLFFLSSSTSSLLLLFSNNMRKKMAL